MTEEKTNNQINALNETMFSFMRSKATNFSIIESIDECKHTDFNKPLTLFWRDNESYFSTVVVSARLDVTADENNLKFYTFNTSTEKEENKECLSTLFLGDTYKTNWFLVENSSDLV